MKKPHKARAGRRRKRPTVADTDRAADGSGLPSGFVTRLLADLGVREGEELLASLARPAQLGLRVNSKVGDVRELVGRLGWRARALPWTTEGVVLEADPGPDPVRGPGHPATSHPWHDAGAYYLQDPSAMGVVPVLDPRPGESILELAAAPGGKSTYIADRLAGTGLLWSHDVDKTRVAALIGNLERWGAANTVVSHGPIGRLAPLHGTFDRVLLDAPCSGEGMFRKSRAAIDMWTPDRVAAYVALQARLLDVAVDFLRPGGVLVYSTCTFGRDENEGAIAALMNRRDDVAPEAFTLEGVSGGLGNDAAAAALAGAVARWWPHSHPGEGHFVARLRKADGPSRARPGGGRKSPSLPGAAPTAAQLAAFQSFVDETLGGAQPATGALRTFGEWLHALPAADLPSGLGDAGLQPRRSGAPLGRQVGSRFEPHHALSRLLPAHGATASHLDLDASDPRVAAYLRGEVITAPTPDGWVLVRAGGLPLGWAKAKHGELNNHYPKGLRHG